MSLVLNEARQGGRKVNVKPAAKTSIDSNKHLQVTVAQMEEQGEYTLAELLQTLAKRRTAASPVKRQRKQGS